MRELQLSYTSAAPVADQPSVNRPIWSSVDDASIAYIFQGEALSPALNPMHRKCLQYCLAIRWDCHQKCIALQPGRYLEAALAIGEIQQ